MDGEIETAAEIAENAVLNRRFEACPESGKTEERAVPEDIAQHATRSPAQWAYERLILYIQNFEETLDSEHEVAMGFAGGDAGILRIEGMGYFEPDLITFTGSDPTGARTQLVQHVSQLSVLMRAVPKLPDHVEPVRIGFRLAKGLDPKA
ncbi:DUF6173 family protein [Pseudaestuariivita atlantica]|uniref:Uncharacterized protein n=1 Tax=Pseudaestuariivita atlantica TaxID=1317121 RepID=A0A0L1JLF3_9RHOB|nr:DUF6173 family protein [Pseudaestuariivita atlantica]KNG92580.1 hypothetical protein ATO11_16275 [Pseudaestuariivita atlantica]